MAILIFIGTLLALLVYFIKIVWWLLEHRPTGPLFRTFIIILASYCLIWTILYTISSDKPIPFGTDVRFDDWCATVTSFERLENGLPEFESRGQLIVLHIKMSNKARGIAQKPSEPKVKITDRDGNTYQFSDEGQQALERLRGRQIPIDSKLELHQSLETQLVFDLPTKSKDLKAFVEEGPFITKLLFYSDREVFLLN
jgi:hypothetical protein